MSNYSKTKFLMIYKNKSWFYKTKFKYANILQRNLVKENNNFHKIGFNEYGALQEALYYI